MKLGLVSKILIPLIILFFLLTTFTTRLLFDLFATEQIKTTQQTALGIASAAAMQIDTSVQAEHLKRVVTMIALGDHVQQSVIINPKSDEVLASSLHRYSNHQLQTLPALMQQAYSQTKQTGVYVFTDINQQHYALAYPITAISENNIDSLDFIMLMYFDTLLLDNQYRSYQHRLYVISAIFLVLLVSLTYGLIVLFVRKPLDIFNQMIKQRETKNSVTALTIHTNDEFEDIANEFNRMRVTEEQSLVVAKQAAEEAKTLAAKKSQFLANMSHELRTPINGILGFSQLSQQAKSKIELNQYLQKLTNSSHLLLSVVNDILDFSKLEEHGIELHPESVSLSCVVQTVTDLTAVLAKEKGLSFDVTIGERCPFLINVDKHRFEQVLLNLSGNAVKFTQQGAITLNVNFIWKDSCHGQLLVAIKDSGIGISPADLKKLFNPFEQADTTSSRHFGGTGLGLAICKELIDLMEGEIEVESNVDLGSEFVISLPCDAKSLNDYLSEHFSPQSLPKLTFDEIANVRTAAVCEVINGYADSSDEVDLSVLDNNWHEPPFLLDEQSLMHSLQNQIWKQNEQQLTAEDDSLTTRLKVLVVEDNEINATVVVNMLRNMGHKAVVAVNGKEALTIHSSMVFDVILMDVQMPVMDGLEATRRIRETDQSIPIIGLSANVLPEDRKKASNAGMSGYLNKPVLMNELKKHLQQISLPN